MSGLEALAMPDHSTRSRASTSATSTGAAGAAGAATSSGTSNADTAAHLRTLTEGTEAEREQVVIYLAQNSVTHHKDEIPETLAALQRADQQGKGKTSMIPISDPFKGGHKTGQYAFGEEAASGMKWWYEDNTLKDGQVKIGEQVLTLGPSTETPTNAQVAAMQSDWRVALVHVGLTEDKAQAVIDVLLKDGDGNAKTTASGAGASNELLQLISVLNRAENGEFDISALVLSGHHYADTDYLFGEVGDHEYDDNEITGDTLNFNDIEVLATVFPKACSQVKTVMFSACNTHEIDQQDAAGNEISTQDWVQGVFPNVENMSNWEGIAPGSDFGAFFSGEYMLDVARKDSGDQGAMGDAYFRGTSKGDNKRYEKGADGKLANTPVKKNTSSYTYNDYKGYRNTNHEAFYEREDLMKYVLKKK
jgi:hypothetical protein